MPEGGGGSSPARHREATPLPRAARTPARREGRPGAGAAQGRAARPTRGSSCRCGGARGSGRRASQGLDLEALEPTGGPARGELPDVVERRCPSGRARGGSSRATGRSCTWSSIAALAERGVILCSLEEAFARAQASSSRVVLPQAAADRPPQARGRERGVLDRRRVPVRAAGAARRGPFEIVYAITGRASRSTGGRSCSATRQRVPRARVRPRARTSRAPVAARRRVRAVPAGRRPLPPRAAQDWGEGEVYDVSTRFVGGGPRRLLPLAAGAARRAPHAPAPRARDHRARAGTWRSAGCSSPRSDEHLDVFAVDLHETGPSGGDVHWRGAGDGREPRELRGADPDRPGRAADATPTCRSTR